MKDLKSLKINFNISQTQEIPLNTSGNQTYTLEQMVNCVMCEQAWEWSAQSCYRLTIDDYVGLGKKFILAYL